MLFFRMSIRFLFFKVKPVPLNAYSSELSDAIIDEGHENSKQPRRVISLFSIQTSILDLTIQRSYSMIGEYVPSTREARKKP